MTDLPAVPTAHKPDKSQIALSLEDLIKAMRAVASPKPTPVPTEEFGLLHVKVQTVEDVDNAKPAKAKPGDTRKRELARGAIRSICDAEGNLLFDESNDEHATLIEQLPWPTLQKILSKIGNKVEDDPEGNEQRVAS